MDNVRANSSPLPHDPAVLFLAYGSSTASSAVSSTASNSRSVRAGRGIISSPRSRRCVPHEGICCRAQAKCSPAPGGSCNLAGPLRVVVVKVWIQMKCLDHIQHKTGSLLNSYLLVQHSVQDFHEIFIVASLCFECSCVKIAEPPKFVCAKMGSCWFPGTHTSQIMLLNDMC